MRILALGDTHGNLEWFLLAIREATDRRCDRILQLGDFGFWEHTEHGKVFLDEVDAAAEAAGINVYWIDGNHENHTLLRRTYTERTAEGFAPIRPHLFWIPRGTRWTWATRTFLALGGAYSIDKEWRKVGRSWWPEETITEEEADLAIVGGPVDVMVTHDAPEGVDVYGSHHADDFRRFPQSAAVREKLLRVVKAVTPAFLFHGHHHRRHQSVLEFTQENGAVHRTLIEGLACDGMPGAWMVLEIPDERVADLPVAA